ncbi:MAG: hypothetical protein LAO20_08625 [Acidobacteriia bacterium]|nr:hypothetical protein [Terriglobia bacterium]
MKRIAVTLAILVAALAANGQSWQSIPPTGNPLPFYTLWTRSVYDYQHKTLLLTQGDNGHGSGIYADSVWGFNPTNGAWTQLWVSDAPTQLCPGDTATRPNHRHTYNQLTWDTLRNQLNVSSGSCQGALGYDWYSFTHSGTANSGSWTAAAGTTPNPTNRQEAAMVYMANVDRVLLYGGFAGANATTSDDTWEYNPATNTWTQICTGCAPGARHAHILVYDDTTGKAILYGGQRSSGGANIAATFIYDPTKPAASRWTAASPTVEAPASAYTCHGYDKQRGRVLIYPTQGHVYSYTIASNTWVDLGIVGGPNPDPGAGDGTADTFCGYDFDHDYFVFFSYPGPGGGPLLTSGINFGHPTNSPPDTTPPTVSMTAPASGASVSGSVTVSATAADNVGVAGVQFQLDGVNLGAEDPASPYSITWNTTSATNGPHTLTAIARDAAGNKTTSAAVSVTVNNVAPPPDTTPPTVSVTAPSNAATVSGSVTVSATASDNVGVVGVQFQLDGVALGAEDLTSPYSVAWDTTKTANGTHTVSAVARDAAGNKTTSSVTITVANTTTPPGSAAGVGVDVNTKYVVELKELAPLVACASCWFATANDLIAGQTLEIRVRPATNPAVADQVILKQGTLDGTVSSVGANQFVIAPAAGNLWPATVTVTTGSVTIFSGFAGPTGPVQAGQKVSVRGLLFKSTPSGVQLVASGVELRP